MGCRSSTPTVMTAQLLSEDGDALQLEDDGALLLETATRRQRGGGGIRSRARKPRPEPKIIRITYDELTVPTVDTPQPVDINALLERLLAIPAPYVPPAPLLPLPTSDDELMLLLT